MSSPTSKCSCGGKLVWHRIQVIHFDAEKSRLSRLRKLRGLEDGETPKRRLIRRAINDTRVFYDVQGICAECGDIWVPAVLKNLSKARGTIL